MLGTRRDSILAGLNCCASLSLHVLKISYFYKKKNCNTVVFVSSISHKLDMSSWKNPEVVSNLIHLKPERLTERSTGRNGVLDGAFVWKFSNFHLNCSAVVSFWVFWEFYCRKSLSDWPSVQYVSHFSPTAKFDSWMLKATLFPSLIIWFLGAITKFLFARYMYKYQVLFVQIFLKVQVSGALHPRRN